MKKKNVVCAHQRFCCLRSCPLFYAAAHFTLLASSFLAASISRFLTADIKFSGCFSNKIRLLCSLSLTLVFSLLSTSVSTLKLGRKQTWLLLFFLSKSPGGPRAKILKFHLRFHTCWLSYCTLVCLWCGRTRERTYGHVTIKSLWCIDNQIFLPMVLRCALFARYRWRYLFLLKVTPIFNLDMQFSIDCCLLRWLDPVILWGYHPTLKLSGIPTFTLIVSLTCRMDNI